MTAGRPRKFTAPVNEYAAPNQQTTPTPTRKEVYRFNAALPMECKDYLQEMAWRNRTSITEYISRLVLADMEAHPEWKDTIDILNT